jgi:hypothetical protein
MRRLGERALEEKFADLVDYGLELRASMTVGGMLDRQQSFIDDRAKAPTDQ